MDSKKNNQLDDQQLGDETTTNMYTEPGSAAKIDIATVITAAAYNKKNKSKVSSAANIPFILDPTSKRMQQWDVLMMTLLLYTATVTPFEIAFIETDPDSFLFFLNRLVDICFIGDMVFNFLLAYQTDDGLWVVDHRMIANRYMRGWLGIDILSCIPYSIISMAVESSLGGDAAETVSQLKILRIVRLLRLAKLLRVVRASRMLKRWETKLALSYAMMSLIKFAILVTTLAHWIACALAIVPQLEQSTTHNGFADNWLTANGLEGSDAGTQYLYAGYWAIMTISTVGYGDISLPTPGEKVCGICAMCVGGAAYAYIVGAICGIVASMDEATGMFIYCLERNLRVVWCFAPVHAVLLLPNAIIHWSLFSVSLFCVSLFFCAHVLFFVVLVCYFSASFQTTMDTLHSYVKENKIPKELKTRLIEYFYYQKELLRASHYTDLLELMTPTLRGEVAVLANG